MSDLGRQSWTDKAEAAIKPDSQKTTGEHFGDMAKGKVDNLAGSAQPQGEKSYGQKAADTLTGAKAHDDGHVTNNNSSLLDKAKHALGMEKH
ncbi:heat shock protein 9/12-domain-containing protein [Auriculariales sp. MPI-PUGE-AT-0066]|nr:heat shock protein 9/12-domain-containing protein [Auriculariales sp. MPI-PUGE-AT-0066]